MVRGTNSQEESKRNLYSNIYLLEDEIKKIKLEIEEINMKIIQECIEKMENMILNEKENQDYMGNLILFVNNVDMNIKYYEYI